MAAPSCSSSLYLCSISYFSCSNPISSCSSSLSTCLMADCVLSLLKVTSLVVGIPTSITGGLVLALGYVISSILHSLSPTSPFLLGDSSIVIGTFEGGCGFPYLILVLFLVLKYKGPCLGSLLSGFIVVLNVANVATNYFSIFPGERLIGCPFFYFPWGLEVFLGLCFFFYLFLSFLFLKLCYLFLYFCCFFFL